MILTGKAKELFSEWLLEHPPSQYVGWKWFVALDKAMQWGIIQDWADSLGFDVIISPWNYKISDSFVGDKTYGFSIHKDYQWLHDECDYQTHQEARDEAIVHLNRIINELE